VSVDTGGLALALERAQKMEDEDRMDQDGEEEGEEEGGEDTVLAEVLSELHTQTRVTIDGSVEGLPW